MTPQITNEMFWLACTVILTALMVIPYAAYRLKRIGGLWQAFMRPLPGDDPFDDDWPHRAYRAHMNAFESIALFAPAIIAIQLSGANSHLTSLAAAVHFWARAAYAPFYYFNVPVLRTTAWFTGLIATLYLAFQIIL